MPLIRIKFLEGYGGGGGPYVEPSPKKSIKINILSAEPQAILPVLTRYACGELAMLTGLGSE